MRWPRRGLAQLAATLLPWAPKHERRAAIAAATEEKERSRTDREHAKAVEEQIKRLARANHYADIIAGDIIRGHHGGKA